MKSLDITCSSLWQVFTLEPSINTLRLYYIVRITKLLGIVWKRCSYKGNTKNVMWNGYTVKFDKQWNNEINHTGIDRY